MNPASTTRSGAFAATRALSNLLFGVSSRDPFTFVVGPLVLAVVAVAAISSADWPKRVQLALYGAITGVLICAKINAGALLAIVVTVASVYALRPGGFSRAAKVACSAGALAFVPLLLFPNLTMPWAQRLLILELCSISALLIAMWPHRAGVQLKWSGLAVIAGAFGATALNIKVVARRALSR